MSRRKQARRKAAVPAVPRGKEEVSAALIVAANELFGKKGPDSVSVREVAARAGVNHALLHRHFGQKEGLLREVLKEHALAIGAAAARDRSHVPAAMFDVLASRPAFVRIVAQLILSGYCPSEWIMPEGGVAKLVASLGDGAPDDTDRLRAALLSSLSVGWLMFERFLLAAAGLEGQEARGRSYVKSVLGQLMASFADESTGSRRLKLDPPGGDT